MVIVGDGAVGKTCLFITYVRGEFPSEYVPTVFENYSSDVPYNGENYLLQMWDTAGQEDYDRLRPLSYPGTDVAILCFSLVSTDSFDSIGEKWDPEITHFLPGVPKILVGTKLDLRDAKIADPHTGVFQEITTEQGNKLAKDIGAVAYIEVSPLKGTNLNKVFEEIIKAAISSKEDDAPKKKKSSSKDKKHRKHRHRDEKDGSKRKHRHRDEKDEDGKKKSSSSRSSSKTESGEKKSSSSSSSKSSRSSSKTADGEKKERRSTRSKTDSDKKDSKERRERKKKDDKKESSSSKSSDKKKKV